MKDSAKVAISYPSASAIFNRLNVCDTIEAAYTNEQRRVSLLLDKARLQLDMMAKQDSIRRLLEEKNTISQNQAADYKRVNALLASDNQRLKDKARKGFWYGLLTGLVSGSVGVLLITK